MPPVEASEFLETAEGILSFLQACQEDATPCALCVVTGVTGGSARAVGTLVAVRADGHMAGYISHGCVDADLCLQAQKAMKTGRPVTLVYGVGSPFIDLQLPCGGTVEVLIDPAPSADICMRNLSQLTDRKQISLYFHPNDGLIGTPVKTSRTGWDGDIFIACHHPALHLVVAGKGPALVATANLATAIGLQLSLYSPDETIRRQFGPDQPHARVVHLQTPSDNLNLSLDPWCAVLMLFHDHDWEPELLKAALSSKAFYIGALGSAQTHEARLKALRGEGLGEQQLARIRGPIGVIPAARDAYTLAVSALAEILDAYRSIPTEGKGRWAS